ncbi:MAG TPA: hypothetical protein VLZ33_00600 [Dysgonamonadaceae bacterium]|nr:hypothetical protein [Dysgonamonadaceae bacterium]
MSRFITNKLWGITEGVDSFQTSCGESTEDYIHYKQVVGTLPSTRRVNAEFQFNIIDALMLR